MNFFSLIFLWLLPLTASQAVTSGQNLNSTDVTIHNLLTTQETSSTQATIAKETTKPSEKPSLQVTPTAPSKTLSPNTRAATPTNFQLSPSSSTVEKMLASATVVTGQASHSTTTPFTSNKTTNSSTPPTESTSLISTKATSTEFESKSPVTRGDTTEPTGYYKTSKPTTKKPIIQVTKAKKREEPKKKASNDSKVVAGIIGGALVLMMVGFLVIYIKKRKLHSQQITTSEWAGPSPFLDGGEDNNQVALRSSNRISLSSFLPQRMSKRLSLLQEADEEMEEMTQVSTFGDKLQGSTFGQEVDGSDEKKSNGTAEVKAETKSTEDAAETVENSGPSLQTNDTLSTNNNSGEPKLSQDTPGSQTTQSGAAPVQLNNGLVETEVTLKNPGFSSNNCD